MRCPVKCVCMCPTYGRRVELLAECVESFLRQDYPEKVLVVYNDFPAATLHCDARCVMVINDGARHLTIGEKYNRMAMLAADADLLFPWEDDDIYLPWKLSSTVARIRETGAPCWHTGRAWWLRGRDDAVSCVNLHHCNLAVRAAYFREHGGYDPADRPDLDQDLFRRLGVKQWSEDIPPAAAHYVYRWGTTNSYHGSAAPKDGSAMQQAEHWIRENGAPRGRVTIHPHWSREWPEWLAKEGKME